MRTSGQLTFETMGGETVTVPVRGKHYIQPRGYADRPGTGPKSETCGSCQHLVHGGSGHKRYPKCELTRRAWTSSRRSDVLVRAAACSKWGRADD